MKIRRKLRKPMRLSEAAELLGISRAGVRNEIFIYKTLRIANEKEREIKGRTAPIKLFEAEVVVLAKQRGIL